MTTPIVEEEEGKVAYDIEYRYGDQDEWRAVQTSRYSDPWSCDTLAKAKRKMASQVKDSEYEYRIVERFVKEKVVAEAKAKKKFQLRKITKKAFKNDWYSKPHTFYQWGHGAVVPGLGHKSVASARKNMEQNTPTYQVPIYKITITPMEFWEGEYVEVD